MQNYVLPRFLGATEERDALIGTGSRGYFLTEAGLAELELRGIRNTKHLLEELNYE